MALDWLADNGIRAVRPVAGIEWRSSWCLRRATLVTEAWPGENLEALLPRLDAAARRRLAEGLCEFVDRLHRLGFRDRNLDLRNLLARPQLGGGYEFTKIDSPRFALVRPGHPGDRRARADWARLLPQFARFGLLPTVDRRPTQTAT
jgi:hypothetical protein